MFPDGAKYIGDWLNRYKHGKGVYIYKDGRIYDGEYSNDNPHGNAKFIYTDGNGDYSEWADGKEIKVIRDLTPEEVAETKQKVKEHEKEADALRQ